MLNKRSEYGVLHRQLQDLPLFEELIAKVKTESILLLRWLFFENIAPYHQLIVGASHYVVSSSTSQLCHLILRKLFRENVDLFWTIV